MRHRVSLGSLSASYADHERVVRPVDPCGRRELRLVHRCDLIASQPNAVSGWEFLARIDGVVDGSRVGERRDWVATVAARDQPQARRNQAGGAGVDLRSPRKRDSVGSTPITGSTPSWSNG